MGPKNTRGAPSQSNTTNEQFLTGFVTNPSVHNALGAEGFEPPLYAANQGVGFDFSRHVSRTQTLYLSSDAQFFDFPDGRWGG